MQQNGPKYNMYKLFAIICVLVNGELDCTLYDDSENQVFQTLARCNQQAEYRFYGMAEVFGAYQIPYDSMEVGCKEIEED